MRSDDRGVAALWIAISLLFLVGVTALVVDVGGFYETARWNQSAADLACLAGVIELPQDPQAAAQQAADFLRSNLPSVPNAPDPLPDPDGDGTFAFPVTGSWETSPYFVEIEPGYGTSTMMRVRVGRSDDSHFGRALGADSVEVVQEAFCEVGSGIGGGDMPFGVFDSFAGGVVNWGKNDCTLSGQSNSQCSGLSVPRHDDPPGSSLPIHQSSNYIANMISGMNWDLDAIGSQPCSLQGEAAGSPEPCNWVATISGDEPHNVYKGLISGTETSNPNYPGSEIGYLERNDGVSPRYSWPAGGGDEYDGHQLEDVAVCDQTPCPTANDSITWGSENPPPGPIVLTEITECACPRFARIPVVENFPTTSCNDPNLDPDDPDRLRKCAAHIIGWKWIFIMRPYFNGTNGDQLEDGTYPDSDFGEAGPKGPTVRQMAAVVLDLEQVQSVQPGCFSDYREGAPKVIRLIDPNP